MHDLVHLPPDPVFTPSIPPNAPVRQVTANKIGTVRVQLASVARKLMISNRIVYNKPFAMPKYQPRLPDRLADTKPPARVAHPWTPNTQGSILDSLKEEPNSMIDNASAPIASHIPDQYNPETTGDAIRKPNMRDNEFMEQHSFVFIHLYQLMA
jgi:hypothetical protein